MSISAESLKPSTGANQQPENNPKEKKPKRKKGASVLTTQEEAADRQARAKIRKETQAFLKEYMKGVAKYSAIRNRALLASARLVMKRHHFPEIKIDAACVPSFDNSTMHYSLSIKNESIDYAFTESMPQALATILTQIFDFQQEVLPLYFTEDLIEIHLYDEITNLPGLAELTLQAVASSKILQ